MEALSPTKDTRRIELMDALRGFAIFGIFLVNMVEVSWYHISGPEDKLLWFGAAEEIADNLLNTLVEGKFYSIFSLLFGIGFGMYLFRKAEKAEEILSIFKRRLWVLLLIGMAHSQLLWIGDIVFLYAWLGFLLIAFRHKSDQWLLKAALICLLVPVVIYPLRFIDPYFSLGLPFYFIVMSISPLIGIENIIEWSFVDASLSSSWKEYFRLNFISFFIRQADLFDQARPFKVFAMFLLGFWASRQLWHQNPEPFLQKFSKWVYWVFPIAILLNIGMAWIPSSQLNAGSWLGWLKTTFYFLGVVPLSLCYVYFFIKAFQSPRFQVLHLFIPVGRVALSNYIFQSVVYTVLMRGVFLGLLGQVNPISCIVLALLIFPFQVAFSHWWLSRYRFGPVEWLWRSLTYGKWQEMKIYPTVNLSN